MKNLIAYLNANHGANLADDASEDAVLKALKSADEANKSKNVKLFLAFGKKAGLIDDKNEGRFEKLADKDVELALEFLDDKPSAPAPAATSQEEKPEEAKVTDKELSLTDLLKNFQGVQPAANNERANWTFSDWEEKDDAGLQAMLKDNPEQYTKLFNAHTGGNFTTEQIKKEHGISL